MTLREPINPQGHYAPATVSGSTVVSAGMTPRVDGELMVSAAVGDTASDVSVERAAELAGLAAARALQACCEAVPTGGRPVRAVALTVYVRADADFTRHTDVADGATRVLVDALGGAPPARAAVGVSSLPDGAPVEVALTVEWASSP